MAIEHGLSILSWFENNQKADIPPEHLWEDSEGLERWWELVDERRASRYGVTGTGPDADTTSEMTGNELAAAFKGD